MIENVENCENNYKKTIDISQKHVIIRERYREKSVKISKIKGKVLKMINGADRLQKLICETVAGNEEAFSEIVRLYAPLTDGIIARYCPPELFGEQDIEDVRQELTIALYDAVLAYDMSREKIEFGLFAKICMTNRVISRLRKQKRTKGREISVSDEMMSEGGKLTEDEPSLLVIDKESVDSINGLIDKNLSKFEKSVFGLYISGYSSSDIADILGTNDKSVDNAIYRMRKKLKKLLA